MSSATGPRLVEAGDDSENDELHKLETGDIITLTVREALSVTGDVRDWLGSNASCERDGDRRARCFCDGCDVSSGGGANDGSSFDDVTASGCTDVRGA